MFVKARNKMPLSLIAKIVGWVLVRTSRNERPIILSYFSAFEYTKPFL